MLSTGASDASNRLRRSKSSASVTRRRPNRNPEGLTNPETARQHALAAAHIAMDRANERASAAPRKPVERSRHGDNGHRSNGTRTRSGKASRPDNVSFRDGIRPRQQQSNLELKTPTATPADVCRSNSRPQFSIVAEDPPLNEFGIFDGCASTPSSYRRLRKTRSLLTPRNQSRSIQDLTLRTLRSPLDDQERGLRLGLKRSMSFLKLNTGNLSRSLKRSQSAAEQHDPAIERARGRFMQEVEQQRMQATTSALPIPKAQQHNTTLNSPCSNTSTRNDGSSWSEQLHIQDKSRFRSFSASVRETVRRVLRRPSSKNINLPVQQLDASRPYFGDYLDVLPADRDPEDPRNDRSHPASRRSLYMPSWQREESTEDFEALSRRVRCMDSSDSLHSNGRSRVTSWTNSTMSNSLPGRSTPAERNRLSIIQEHGGPHQPSSSVGQHIDEIFSHHVPFGARQGNARPTCPIDSQRVYSALMKRIEQEQGEQDRAKTPKPKAWQGARTMFTSHDGSFQTVPTVRKVPSEESAPVTAADDRHLQPSRQTPVRRDIEYEDCQQAAQESQTLEKRSLCQSDLDAQSPCFPLSDGFKPPKSSPFKLALATCSGQHLSSDGDSNSVIITRPNQCGDAFEIRSDSQYSRTPSGETLMAGSNQSELGYSEQPAGLLTIAPTRASLSQRPLPSLPSAHGTTPGSAVEVGFGTNAQITSAGGGIARLNATHYREGAQIDGDDTNVGGRPLPSVERTRQSSASAFKLGATPNQESFQPPELRELPRNKLPTRRRSFSLSRKASSVAADVKRSIGAVTNDENARVPFNISTNLHSLASKYSEPALNYGEQLSNSPGWLRARNQPRLYKKRSLGQCQDVRTLSDLNRPSDMMESSRDLGTEPNVGSRNMPKQVRSDSPLDDSGYGDKYNGTRVDSDVWTLQNRTNRPPTRGPSTPPPRPPPHLQGLSKPDPLTVTATILPSRIIHPLPPSQQQQQQQQKKRERKTGLGMGRSTSSSKRMVSNFLRSRRRNTETGGNATVEEEQEQEQEQGRSSDSTGAGAGMGVGVGFDGGEEQRCPAFV